MATRNSRSLSLYLHVPFCRARCLYCAFPSRPAGPSTQTHYIERLCGEVLSYCESNPQFSFKTVYVGGGTPSTIGNGDIEYLLQHINRIAPDAEEITFEVNPHVDDIPKLPALHANGVTRLSIGIQSFNDNELSIAGRLHNSDDTREFIKSCREIGFDNVSFDFIHGLPGQILESFQSSLETGIEYNPEHISLYGLSVESESRLGRLSPSQFRGLDIPSGDEQADMYMMARNILGNNGYSQYEISNFAKPGFECRHNIVYWTGGEYIGFGPGAVSYVDGVRFKRIADVSGYLEAQEAGKNTIEVLESLSSGRAAAEALIMGLRLATGVSMSRLETKYGIRLTDLVGEAIEKYSNAGLMEVRDDEVRLTDKAYFISNSIFSDLVQ